MTTQAEALAALQEAWSFPVGRAQARAFERACDLADACGDTDLQVQARLNLCHANGYVNVGAAHLTPVAWLLAAMDRGELSPGVRESALWYVKSAVEEAVGLPDVPRAALLGILEDFRRRCLAEGYGEHAYLHHRTLVSERVESPEQTRDWLARWRASSRDRMSDCVACERAGLVRVLLSLGEVEEALAAARELLDGTLTCQEEPQLVQARLLDPLARAGQGALARELHLAKWREIRLTEQLDAGKIHHLVFLARAGEVGAAAAWIAELGSAQEEWGNQSDRMEYLGGAAAILQTAAAVGEAPAQVAGEEVGSLAARWSREADAIAAALDARNETTYESRLLADLRDLTPYPDGPDLSDQRALAPARAWATPDAPDPVEDDAEPVGIRELAGRMQTAALQQSADGGALIRRWVRVRESVQPQTEQEWADKAYLDRLAAGGSEDPMPMLRDAQEAAVRSGDRDLVLRTQVAVDTEHLARAESSADPETDALLAQVRAGLEELEEHGAWGLATGGWMSLSAVLGAAHRHDEAEAALHRAVAAADREGAPTWRVLTRVDLAPVVEDGRAIAREALSLAEGCAPQIRAHAHVAALFAARHAGDLEEARGHGDQALALAEERLWLRTATAQMEILWEVDRPALSRLAAETYSRALRAGATVPAGVAQYHLGLVRCGEDPSGAVTLLESALATLRGTDYGNLPDLLIRLAVLLRHLGMPDSAATTWREAAEEFHRYEAFDAEAAGRVQEADNLAESGSPETVLVAAGAEELCVKTGFVDGYVRAVQARITGLENEGREEEAITAVDDLLGRLPGLFEGEGVVMRAQDDLLTGQPVKVEWLVPRLRHRRAYLCQEVGRDDEALVDMQQAAQEFAALDPEAGAQGRAELGRFLVDMGRLEEALPVLKDALAHLEDEQRKRWTVAVLVRVLLDLGREDEARELERRHGFAD